MFSKSKWCIDVSSLPLVFAISQVIMNNSHNNLFCFSASPLSLRFFPNFKTTLAQDLTPFDEGIAPLTFKSLRVVSFPGGQQYGSINPCEMNEFSDECAVWEDENGPYKKGDFMVKSNERTKGR